MDYTGLAVTGSVLAGLSGLYYVWTILKGYTKPQRVTWFGWALVAILGAWSSDAGGGGKGSWVAITYAVILSVIFLLTLIPKYSKPGGQPLDYLIAAAAASVLISWKFINLSPTAGAALAIVADSWFTWLTIRDTWSHPETESVGPWLVGVAAVALGIAALAEFNFASAGYLVYILLADSLVVGVILSARSSLKS